MREGWIKLHRKLLNNDLWICSKPFSDGQAWVDLLLLVTYDRGVIRVANGSKISLRRGECGYSVLGLSGRWGWSRGKVKRFLNFLESEKMIQQKIIHKTTIVKVLNFDFYQGDTVNSTTNGQQTSQQTDTIEERKEGKKRKERKELSHARTREFEPCAPKALEGERFLIPSLKEVEDYCRERANSVDSHEFFDFYSSKGWMVGKNKMADWRASLRGWERIKDKKTGKDDPVLRAIMDSG